MTQLVLSLFPGIGLLDMAFEEEGFCVVRGPDLLWGGDIRNFHPPAGKFDGVIGGPPCQRFSGLGNVNRKRWGDASVMPNLIPEFERVVSETRPEWFLMENVPAAPVPVIPGYGAKTAMVRDVAVGGVTSRLRRFTFGRRGLTARGAVQFAVEEMALHSADSEPTVTSTGQKDWQGSAKRHRAAVAYMAEAQGLERGRFQHSPFTVTELRRAIANGVPLPMGRAVARAVRRALGDE